MAAGLAALAAALLLAMSACRGDDSSGASSTPAGSEEASPAASGASPTRPPDCGPPENQFGIISKLLLGGSSGLFKKGDAVPMTLVLTNCADNAAHLSFPTSQRYVFIIQNADTLEEAWRSSDGKSYAQVVGEEAIQPSESVQYTETWDQKSSKGEQVAAGRYKVLAFSVGCPASGQTDCQFGPVGFIQVNE